jgi:phage terminase small subunit
MSQKASKQKIRKPRTVLTPRQEAFAQHYATYRNASEALRLAYPGTRKWKPDAVYSRASRLLADAKVKARVEELMQRVQAIAEKRFDITAERVLAELAAIAFANADDYFSWGTLQRPVMRGDKPVPDDDGKPVTEDMPFVYIKPSDSLTRTQKAAIVCAELSFTRDGLPVVGVKMADKRAALRDLGHHLGLFKTDVRLTGAQPIPVVLSSAEAAL